MAWTQTQQRMFFIACNVAGINDEQRYMVMRYVGCPVTGAGGSRGNPRSRPSAKHPKNTQHQFELAMATAESRAAENGQTVKAPRNFPSWHEAAVNGKHARIGARIDRVLKELEAKVPAYDWIAQLGKLIEQMRRAAADEAGVVSMVADVPQLGTLDAMAQLKVLRGLEAIGRKELKRRGYRADFDQEDRAQRRAS